MVKIAILASGSGSNAEELVKYFKGSDKFEVCLIISNNKNAFVLDRAKRLVIKSLYLSRKTSEEEFLGALQQHDIDFIILAGWLSLIPASLLRVYKNKIVNIHPSLLPKYGGKGMYGDRVHRAVIEANESESGISIHYVNEKYDEGELIAQFKCEVSADDTADSLAQKIHKLEHAHYPAVCEATMQSLFF